MGEYLQAHGTWQLLVIGLLALLITEASYLKPGSETMRGVLNPILSRYLSPMSVQERRWESMGRAM